MAKNESPDVAARRARRPGWRVRLRRARNFTVFVFKALCLIVLFTIVIFFDRIAHDVHSGQRGVRWDRFGGGTVLDRTYEEGMHLTWPWDEFYVYDIREQHFDQETLVYARDGLEIKVKTSIRFRPTAATLPILHHEIGPDYVNKIIVPESVSTLRKVLGNYTPEMIYSRDEEGLLAEIGDTLRKDLDTRYFEVIAFLVLELRLPTNIEDAIQSKLTEEQNMLSYRFRLDRERDEKQRRLIEAEGLRDFEATSGISILRWRGIEATENLAKSPNTKIVLMGTGEGQLPVLLNMDGPASPPVQAPVLTEVDAASAAAPEVETKTASKAKKGR